MYITAAIDERKEASRSRPSKKRVGAISCAIIANAKETQAVVFVFARVRACVVRKLVDTGVRAC